MSILAELWAFMRVRKKYWLAPILLMLLVFGGLVILYVHLIYSLDLVSLCGPDAWLDSATINEIRTKTQFFPMPTSWNPPASEPVSYGMPIWSVYFHLKEPGWIIATHVAFLAVMFSQVFFHETIALALFVAAGITDSVQSVAT